jgi:hypothetical protein
MSERIEVFFVGCGAFAHRYHVPALVADADVSIAAVFDPTPSDATRASSSTRKGRPSTLVGNGFVFGLTLGLGLEGADAVVAGADAGSSLDAIGGGGGERGGGEAEGGGEEEELGSDAADGLGAASSFEIMITGGGSLFAQPSADSETEIAETSVVAWSLIEMGIASVLDGHHRSIHDDQKSTIVLSPTSTQACHAGSKSRVVIPSNVRLVYRPIAPETTGPTRSHDVGRRSTPSSGPGRSIPAAPTSIARDEIARDIDKRSYVRATPIHGSTVLAGRK